MYGISEVSFEQLFNKAPTLSFTHIIIPNFDILAIRRNTAV